MTGENLAAGLRVVDFTTAWAGPFIGRFLGGIGADVVKVESATHMDVWRSAANTHGDNFNRSANFNALNRNKRSLSLQVSTEQGRGVFLRLVETADVVIANFTARVLPNLGITYDILSERNKGIILLNMPALGATGPYSQLAGYGSVIEGFGGMAERFGYHHEEARVSQTFYPDGVAGIHGVAALLAAMRRQKLTGAGCVVDLSQQEALLLQFSDGMALHSLRGRGPSRMENAEPRCVPSGFFPTADSRWVAVVVRSDDDWKNLLNVPDIGLGDYSSMDLDERIGARASIHEVFAGWTAQRSLKQILGALDKAGIKGAPVNDIAHAQHSEVLVRLGAIETVEHPATGLQPYVQSPIRFDTKPMKTQRPAPLFGEHTDAVLRDWLEMSAEEISELRRQKVVIDSPNST